ncbi:MAG: hypothetical protein ACK56W_16905 [Pirellula sp.]|jgi:hypothetical protein|nr:hypothetical protein [Pirellula sp.]
MLHLVFLFIRQNSITGTVELIETEKSAMPHGENDWSLNPFSALRLYAIVMVIVILWRGTATF